MMHLFLHPGPGNMRLWRTEDDHLEVKLCGGFMKIQNSLRPIALHQDSYLIRAPLTMSSKRQIVFALDYAWESLSGLRPLSFFASSVTDSDISPLGLAHS